MKKIYSILSLLLLCSIVAFADSERVVIASDIASNVTYSIDDNNVVTLTVTPAEGKYLTDISAMKTVDASVAAPQRRTDIPVAAYTLTKTSTTADRSQEATYTMTLEDGFGAYVTATFADRTAITADQITLSAASFTYDGSDQKATVSIDGLTLDTDYTISYKETEWKDAGTYTVTITGIDSYKGTIEKTFEIQQVATEITINDLPMELLVGEDINIGAVLTPAEAGSLVYTSDNETVATVDETGTITALSEGTAKITVSFPGNKNYAAANSEMFGITVSLNPTSVTTNLPSTPFEMWIGDSYALVATTTPTGLNVTYIPDNSGVVSVDENGVVTALKEGTASITVKVGDNKVYAENSTVATFTVIKIPTVLDVTVNYPQTYDPMSNFLVNGTVKMKETEYGVDKGAVDIYLNEEFKLTVNVDNAGSFSCDLGPLNAGTYKLYAKYSDESGKFDEAEWPVNTATFEIGKKSLTIDESSVSINDKVYDGTTSATISGSASLVGGDQVTVSSSGVSATFADENVGSNKVVTVTGFALDGADNNNYELTNPGFTLKGNITKAPLTVTAKDNSIKYGDEAANDGVTYNGFVNNEDASVLVGTLDYSYTNNKGAYGEENNAIGTYQITPSGLTSDNYAITFVPGTLTVDPKPNTAYTVKHYQQNLADDGYPTVATATEDKTGAGGEQTAAEAKEYKGFTAQAFSQETIAADGTTVVKIYYTRNKYNVTLPAAVAEGSITTADGTANLKYGASITLTITTNEGYTLKSICATGGATLAGSGHTRTLTMADQAVSVQADWEAVTPESKTTEVTENVTVVDANNAEVSSIEVGAETTTVTISGTVNDGTNDVPVTSIADGTFTTENTANVLSIDLSETQVDLDMDRKADGSPVKDVPDNTLIYLPAGSTMTGDNVIVKGAGSDFTCNNFVMDDEKSYNVPHPFTANNATLNREFTANQTCTVCLPYDVPAAGVHGKIYTFTSVANNQVTMTEDADGLNANVPYIFVPDGTDNISVTGSITVEIVDNNTSANDFTFKGIYEDHTFTAEEIAKGVFGFAGANAVGATPGHFAKAATGAYIKAKRAYLEYTGSATNPDIEGPDVPSPRFGDLETPLPNSMDVILVDADGTTTNIGKMELMEDGETPRYNLSGQRVGKSHKGIVIENSKKMVIK